MAKKRKTEQSPTYLVGAPDGSIVELSAEDELYLAGDAVACANAREWARCNSCGSEVEFQAWVDFSGRVTAMMETSDNWCSGCERSVKWNYTVVQVQDSP